MELPISLDDGGKLPLCVQGWPEGQCSDQREVLKYGIPCIRRQSIGTSCCPDVLVHESTHLADLF